MGIFLQGKALVWGGGTLLAGGAVAALIYAALREPEPAPMPEAPAAQQPDSPAEAPAPVADVAPESAPESLPALADQLADVPADDDAGGRTEEAAQEPAAEPAVASDPEADTDPEADFAVAPVPPGFDVVRIEPDGGALVAGLAPAGAVVLLRLDGAPLLEAIADAAGQFVVLFTLEPSAEPQLLTLEAQLADGRVLPGEDQVILAPRMLAVPPIAELPAPAMEPAAEPAAELAQEPAVEPEPPLVMAETGELAAEAPASLLAEAPAAPAAPVEEGTGDLAAAMPEALPEPLAETAQAETPPSFLLRGTGEVALLDRAPQVMDNVVIEAISYGTEGEVQISGRAAGGADSARLQIYLDNAPISMAQARNGGWASDLPAVAPGLYTLRVDQLDDEGAVVSRFETPFQREDPARLAQARAPEPEETPAAPGATGPASEPVAELPAEEPAEPAVDPIREPVAETPAVPAEAPVAEAPVAESPAEIVAEIPAEAEEAPLAEAPAPAPQEEAAPAVQLLTVQPGHSLWRISRAHYGEGVRYVQIFEANRDQIRNPDLIYPGQVFILPD